MLEYFAKKIHDEVYKGFHTYKITLFLCGAGRATTGSVRERIDDALRSEWYWYKYDMFYPEDLFDDLLLGPGHHDLISLENTLAESVDAVVLVVESYGAVAELGSFASNNKLRKKLVCVMDEKHRKEKSFIQHGPLRLLRDKREGEIVYGNYANVASMIEPIRRAVGRIRSAVKKNTGVTNVVQAHHFILPCVFLFEPVTRDELMTLVKHASGTALDMATVLATGAISILTKNRYIVLAPDGYKLTPSGLGRFASLGRRGLTGHTYDPSAMDKLRTAVLNWHCRGKKLRI
ncbi:MAG: retron St85 family effector protein [Candidatus Eisenbacteria bacterium]|uniref:Retron St85 family effector protein n=1 Tax=Eiseniibacteriota bacterium TaxID=2212470 RepID=A0A948RZF5_UNCEI|nr:retron St85 family effector protein [Candidatus Eisenbacteria bacterium]MBU1949554.1 retron St85 family effector protein [Candidatus Eisenbacteria bacterium]MBU2691992.1 retron St85 family effector protein [Candidatus Eisenbacteria bacterium]